jgi:replicative DNA helicase Mcm
MAEHILKSHLGGEIKEHRSTSENPKYSKDDEETVLKGVTPLLEPKFLQKYIAYARRIIYPVMTEEAIQELAEFYVHLRTQEGSGETTVVAITPRQLEALVRIAEASARMRLSEQVTNEDTERAIKISQYYLKRVASDSGILDIDMIATGVGHSQRSRIIELMDIIRTLGESDKSGNANEAEVLDEAEGKGYDREQIKADIGKLMREGRIFKPTEKNIRIV